MKVIINADDFGFSKSVNEGIWYAFEKGLISTTTMMMNQPGTDEACELWKANPQIAVGLHVNLSVGKPLTNGASLINKNGEFHYNNLGKSGNENYDYGDLYAEIEAQLKKLMQYGKPDHLDAHRFIDKDFLVRKAMCDVAEKYALPLRDYEKLSFDFFEDKATAENFKRTIRKNSHLDWLEIMTHVGFIDEDTKSRTSYLTRENEIRELEKLKDEGVYDTFELVTFKDL